MARPRISRQLYMTQVTEATAKTNCLKKHFAPPHLETTKDIAPTSGETLIWDRAVPSCKYLSHGKNTHFPYRGLPWGLPSHAVHFWKALVEPMLKKGKGKGSGFI